MEDNNRIKIDKKIKFLIKFCQENKLLWLNRENKKFYLDKIEDEKLRKKVKSDLEKAIKYYTYVRVRKSRNQLKEEHVEMLYKSDVGGVFAFPDEVKNECKEISKKYEIKLQNVKNIIAHFGSMDTFKNYYINYIISDGFIEEKEMIEKYIDMLNGKLVDVFDLSEKNMACEYLNYIELNKIPKYTILIDSQNLIDETERVLKLLPPDWESILRDYYGIGEERVKSSIKIGTKWGCSHQNISQKIVRAQEVFLEKRKSLKEIGIIQNRQEKEEMLNYFKENCDIFHVPTEEVVLNKEEPDENKEKTIFEYIKNEHNEQQKNSNLTPIERLNLSFRATNALKRNGVLYVEELAKKTLKELMDFNGLGKKSYNEIISAIDENGKKIFNEELNIDSELEKAIKGLKQAYEELNNIIEECRKNNNKSIEKTYIRKRHIIAKELRDYGIEVEEK